MFRLSSMFAAVALILHLGWGCQHHEEAENLLITFVFTQDIGAKD